MSRKIWKFELKLDHTTDVSIPVGSTILSVQTDQKTDKPCLWALVNPDVENETRCICLVMTGKNIHEHFVTNAHYIGTFQHNKGSLIYHAFEYIMELP